METIGRSTAILLVGALLAHGTAIAGATITGKVDAPRPRDRVNAVVFVDRVEGEFAPPSEPAVMDQKNLEFLPHVLPVLAGTTVDFLNSDEVLHNVFSPDLCARKFNLGSWPKGEVRSHRFDKPSCQAVMLCNIHPEMEAYIVTLQNPFYAVTDTAGAYRIEDVPPGSRTLRVWHERLAAEPVQVDVPESGSVEVNFRLRR